MVASEEPSARLMLFCKSFLRAAAKAAWEVKRKAFLDKYDTNHDGSLTLAEVTADIRLDKRPLPEILSDPSAIDWNSLAARAGSAAPLLKKLFEL